MSANFYELLKYAQTGISSPDMTYYDKMRASTLMGGATVQTLTGIPPLTFKADGTPLISWSMKGNGQQTGTPTPENPVMPEFVGVRTGNLFDISSAEKGRIDNGTVGYKSGTTDMTVSGNAVSFTTDAAYRGVCFGFIEIPNGADSLSFSGTFSGGGGIGKKFVFYDSQKTWLNADYLFSTTVNSGTASIPNGAKYVRLSMTAQTAGTASISDFMLNTGSTALPYEPFGWAEKITCAGQTTPVYLGEVPTVRRVRKLVLDGTENWVRQLGQNADYFRIENMPATASKVICSHYQSPDENIAYATVVTGIKMQASASYGVILACRPPDIATLSLSDFKAYLASEYAAGHPVTVWYILAEPETTISNEPLCKISTYADDLSSTDASVTIPTVKGQNVLTVDTPIQPSEMTITFKG